MKVDYWPPDAEVGGVPGDIGAEVSDPDEVLLKLGPADDVDDGPSVYLSGMRAIELGQELIAAGSGAVVAQVAKLSQIREAMGA